MTKKSPSKPASSKLPLWVCPNCGQHHFGEAPPDMCDYCHDFTTWRRVGSADADIPPPANDKPKQ